MLCRTAFQLGEKTLEAIVGSGAKVHLLTFKSFNPLLIGYQLIFFEVYTTLIIHELFHFFIFTVEILFNVEIC